MTFFSGAIRSNFRELPALYLVIFGGLMIVVMIFYPGGFSTLYDGVVGWPKAKVTDRQRS